MSMTQHLKFPDELGPTLAALTSSDIVIRMAENSEEIKAAQKLRYRVFYEEMKATACADAHQLGLDHDRFDATADHLLVIDKTQIGIDAQVVGTYRLLRQSKVNSATGFYSHGEFDLAKLTMSGLNLLELGRSCIDANYRQGKVMDLLWRGLAAYFTYHDIDVMFGCASLQGTDPDALMVPLSYLYHNYMAPNHLCPTANPGQYVDMNRVSAKDIDNRRAFATLPPMIKGYLRAGCLVGDGAVVDYQFNTIDVCIVMKVEQITSRYQNHFIKDPAGL